MKRKILLIATLGIASAAAFGALRPSAIDAGAVAERDLPAGTLDGLRGDQKAAVLAALNALPDECGIPQGTYAKCYAHDPARPRSARAVALAIDLAKLGRGGDEIAAAVRHMPTATTAPPPALRLREGRPVEAAEIHVHAGAEGNH